MPKLTKQLDHEPTFWEKVQAFFGGYNVVNVAAEAEDVEHLPDNASEISDWDESSVDDMSVLGEEDTADELLHEPDDGILDVEPKKPEFEVEVNGKVRVKENWVTESREEQEYSEFADDDDEVLSPEETDEIIRKNWGGDTEEEVEVAPPKVGFFRGLWNAVKTFFGSIFKRAPKEEPQPEVPKAEEQPMFDTPEIPDDFLKDPTNHRVEVERAKIQTLVNGLEGRNEEFVKQVNEIAKNGPDDIRRFLAFANEGTFQMSNDTFEGRMEEIDEMDITDRQKEILKNNAVKDMVERSIEESGRDIDEEIEDAEMRNMGIEDLPTVLE